jgi:putative ABC transport system permease protein
MLSNYFKIAIRAFLRFKGYTTINLIGLALGLTAGLLIILYVSDELSYDKFHSNLSRIYRVESEFVNNSSGSSGRMESNAWPIGHLLRTNYPEVEAVAYTRGASAMLINHEGRRIRQANFFVSPEFLKIFSFPLVKGNPDKALDEPYSIVISESMENKYFAGQSGLNKSITLADTLQFVVTGVMKDVPSNSHIQADMFLSFATFQKMFPDFSYNDGWGNMNMRNYLMLKEGVDAEAFFAKARNIYMDNAASAFENWGVKAYVAFAPLKTLYLTTKSGNGMGSVGSMDRLYLVGAIAVFVILLACINFINLATARSVYRAKEVGLRKVVGSSRRGLIQQFLSESFLLTILALLVALAFSGLALPLFNQLLNKQYAMMTLLSPPMVSGMVVLIVIVSILSGYYPAWAISGLRPVEVLKGKSQSSARGSSLRRFLVVFQFVISIGLVLGTLIVLDQLSFMQKQELGFNKDEIFVINAARVNAKEKNGFEVFKNELAAISIVNDVSYSNAVPGTQGWPGQVAYPEGKTGDAAVTVEYVAVDDQYLQTLGLTLVAGRNFELDRKAQLEDGLVLNETAVARFGWTSPEEAIGKKITSPSGYPAGEVIGVVRDYHQLGLQQGIGPIVMDYNPGNSFLYAIRYRAADSEALLTQTAALWEKHFSGNDFNYFFLDENFEKQYQSEQRLAKVFGLYAVITVIIALVGLLGLVSFMVTARTKEIGVRKVLGADVTSIVTLLSREFIVLVLIGNAVAIPIAWYFASSWLENFAIRTAIDPLIFILTLFVALVVTLATISIQTIKAAVADPVKSL